MQVVYLDSNATTRPDPAVVQAMLPYLTEWWGNPNSVHRFGQAARAAIDEAVVARRGIIGKHTGDGVTAFFLADEPRIELSRLAATDEDPTVRAMLADVISRLKVFTFLHRDRIEELEAKVRDEPFRREAWEGQMTSTTADLVAAYQALLHRYTGQTDLVVGTPIAGRTRPRARSDCSARSDSRSLLLAGAVSRPDSTARAAW